MTDTATTETTKAVRIKIDGLFIVVEGNCPMCDWEQSHSHIAEAFHEFIENKRKGNKTSGTVTNADPVPKALPKVTHPSTPASTPASKPAAPVKKINVYRIRTVGGGLSLDRTIMGNKKKEAVGVAVGNHERMLNLETGAVSLTFCQYIGQLPFSETYSHSRGLGYGWDL